MYYVATTGVTSTVYMMQWPSLQAQADQEFDNVRKKNRKAPRPDKITQRRLWREQAALRGRG